MGGGARSPPGTPNGSGWGQGQPPLLESAIAAGGRNAAESPRPGAAQRLAAPPPPGPHSPAPIPLRWALSRAGGRAPGIDRLFPAPSLARDFPGDGCGGHLLRVPRPRGDSRPGAARPRAGLLLAPGASSRRPASITAGAPGRKAGAEMRGLLKGQRSFLGVLALSPSLHAWPLAPPASHSEQRNVLLAASPIVPFGAWPSMCKVSFQASFEIPWLCLEIWPILGAGALKTNMPQSLIAPGNLRYRCWHPPLTFGTEAENGRQKEGKLEGNLAGSHWGAKDIPSPGAALVREVSWLRTF